MLCSCLKGFCPFFRYEEWHSRETILLKQIKNMQDSLEDMVQRYSAVELELNRTRGEFMAKESQYMQQLNELQNRLHQQEVVMQQYKIYETNLQKERQGIAQLHSEIEELKKKNQMYKHAIQKIIGDSGGNVVITKAPKKSLSASSLASTPTSDEQNSMKSTCDNDNEPVILCYQDVL